ncbi:MAG TPA: hypothetical protein VHU83_06745 [Bryobacteraceae bacterium]|jgi:hypothetical protein|nr:hypothetical protein [Bryobacteraceae bacterium]
MNVWHILSLTASISVPVTGWLLRAYINLRDRVIKSETLIDVNSKQADAMQTRFDELSRKLEILPRIDESLKHLSLVCEKIVPRDEVDARFKALEDTLHAKA